MAQNKTVSVKITAAVVLGAGVLGRPGETYTVSTDFATELLRRGKAELSGSDAPDAAAGAGPAEQVNAAAGGAPSISEGSLADKVRTAIEALDADGYLASGAPDLKAIKAKLAPEDAAQVSAAIRDEVFGAMVQGGFTAPVIS